ncbi:MAG: hypothetical protein HC888_12410 [Candidatus Competibacteraceae bacterium]|nr:hypothetical protein [Candidatus Competibacteraceae bacterium]
MKRPTLEEQRALAQQWHTTGPVLERIRREALRDKPYDWKEVDALLSLAELQPRPTRLSSGIEEMQYWFMRARK